MSKIISDAPSLRESPEPSFAERLEEAQIRTLGGEEAARRWKAAINAIQAFAHASGCPAGDDVIRWFDGKTADYESAAREAWITHRKLPGNRKDGSSPKTTEASQ